MNMTEKLQVSQVIERPKDEELLARLQEKLEEYRVRIGEYSHPEQQMLLLPGGYFKHRILKTVLDGGKAEWGTLTGEIKHDFPDAWEAKCSHFPDAWAVIWDYCVHAGKHTISGMTGQPGLA